jgi:hypothetical protein
LKQSPPGHGRLLRHFAGKTKRWPGRALGGQASGAPRVRPLDGAPATRDFPRLSVQGDPMGWSAILLIAAFVVATGVLNRIEFGRFD